MREITRTATIGRTSAVVILSWLIMACFSSAHAETCAAWVGKVVSAQGNVEAKRLGEPQWRQVQFGALFCPGDMVRVRERSRADILMSSDTVIRLDQNTTITFPEPEAQGTSLIDLLDGAAYFFSRFPRGLKVKTPFVNASVEGTEFFIRVESDRTVASIFEGTVALTNDAGSLTLTTGQSAEAAAHKGPVLRVVVHPRDAVRWALYYPPVLFYRAVDFRPESPRDWQAALQRSAGFYGKGDIDGAFREIADVPDDLRDPRFFVYRASLLLSVGRVDEARMDAERALSVSPDNAAALSLEAVVAVVRNDRDGALGLGRRAVRATPDSAASHIALSYALQASFDLNGALDSLKTATEAEPENALAWARLAELYLSFGELDQALKAAQKAASLAPDLSRTQTVLGYAYLSELRTAAAKEVFEKAILLDQADPLPRLGLGLAKIKENDLSGGRSDIEIASSLDPGNSLIRSYQGKAYYEEKRDGLAADQYRMAKDLDPLDPTPWLYDSFRKRTSNRPVEALQDVEKSIALNDNRAVFRSRELLDEDLAVRSVGLGSIYADLGFEQLGLVEGWKAVHADPANFSAHRFLAQTYSALPRHEIARVSELLQSQLLQPINTTPVQPSLGEANLFILEGAGPTTISLDEFDPLFVRDRVILQGSGVWGSEGTFGDQAVLSGLYKQVSFSAGQFHYETDGFRDNNDQKQNIYNAFVQMNLSPRTTLQAEFRYRDIERGDLTQNFFPDDFLPGLRVKEVTRTSRLGFHHTLSQGSDLIGTVAYQNADGHLRDTTAGLFSIGTDEESYSGEIQYLFRRTGFNVVAGSGYFNVDTTNTITFDSPSGPLATTEDQHAHHTNVYLYASIDAPGGFIVTAGASGDLFGGGIVDRDQFNPKLGVTWTPCPSTTMRAAVFRTFQRTFINDQTLEPTQVAGFSQFFDDPEGSEAWRYGIALDQKLPMHLYAGAEYSWRDLEVPYRDVSSLPLEVRTVDWQEQFGRLYLYWTPRNWVALIGEYQYEWFKRDRESAFGIEKLKTQYIPLGINLYHPSGLSMKLRATYVDQEGRFIRQSSLPGSAGIPGSDQFWVVDAAVSYRLPRRLGIVSVEARNLFDESFRYQGTVFEPLSPRIQPERLVLVKLSLAL